MKAKKFIAIGAILCILWSIFVLIKADRRYSRLIKYKRYQKYLIKHPLPLPPKEPYRTDEHWAEVKNPVNLPDKIPVERIKIGKIYKSNITKLSDDTLLCVGMACEPTADIYYKNPHPLLQSKDGGKTWITLVDDVKIYEEPFLNLAKDDILIMTSINKIRDKKFFLHRSIDKGKTWQMIKDVVASSGKTWISTRNVLVLNDESLIMGISSHERNSKNYIYRSFDNGLTWPEKYKANFRGTPKNYRYTILGEAYLWQAKSNKLYAIMRVGYRNSWPIKGTVDPGINDHSERMVVFSSTDLGHNWKFVGDLGWYGEHYPSILKLQNGLLLLTFTIREPFGKNEFPHGLRAVLGTETYDGFEFNMENDRIMLDTKSPLGRYPISWGDMGGTVQLLDGTLVSVYSYGGYPGGDMSKNRSFTTEIVRWKIQ